MVGKDVKKLLINKLMSEILQNTDAKHIHIILNINKNTENVPIIM